MNYDRVIVMSKGTIIECGSPGDLAAAGSDSHFGAMVIATGLSV
jgi:ABC-type multidrug transport system fused ATPase/permease subunit